MKRIVSLSLLIALAGVLAGCATTAGTTSGKTVPPEVRAIERWNHLIARDAEKAYDYMSPGRRATKSRDEYAKEMNNRPVRWEKVALYKHTPCEATATTCKIVLQVDARAPLPGTAGEAATLAFPQETWIRDKDGQWYYLGGVPKDQR